MITKISIDKIASYKSKAVIETDKKVNLIYGLNGTGKSTLSNFLLNPLDPDYTHCSIEGIDSSHQILVYNQKFVLENFYESDDLKGIFTLSQRNTDAEKAIKQLSNEQKEIDKTKDETLLRLKDSERTLEELVEKSKEDVWEIKTKYSGGDRVLEYCLEGLKRKDTLFAHIAAIAKPEAEHSFDIKSLKDDVASISGDNIKTIDELLEIQYDDKAIVESPLLSRVIVGNQDSTLSKTIDEIGNSDWVGLGQKYINLTPEDENPQSCPFCQEKSITKAFISELLKLYDKSYEEDIAALNAIYHDYVRRSSFIPTYNKIESLPSVTDEFSRIALNIEKIKALFESNVRLIQRKIQFPSGIIKITSARELVSETNIIIGGINEKIRIQNGKVKNRAKALADIKTKFWLLMRVQFDKMISQFKEDYAAASTLIDSIKKEIAAIDQSSETLRAKLQAEQAKTINISAAVRNIENGLADLGIDSFAIKNHEGNLYRIVRPGESENTFVSLSEGEKMIISFLYFIEMCKGKRSETDTASKKVIVIDDPISSLSHIYVFNISQLIKSNFTSPKSEYEQVFILTHSLYFFYDLSFMKPQDRELYQKLFRISKNSNGSQILAMSHNEVQNDYQTYWQVIKDKDQPSALIANCMRNIIEYFFEFVERSDLNNTFQKPSLKDAKFQAFLRYINRESHSLAQNIFDIKEFDYDAFREGFRLVFAETGYEDHYKKMIR